MKRCLAKTVGPVMAAAVMFGANAEIPIVGWSGLPPQMASAERYGEAKDAGFTHLTQWCKTSDDARRLLSEAGKAGVKLIIGFAANGSSGIKRMTDEAEAFALLCEIRWRTGIS